MKLSLILPVYNTAPFLRDCMTSLLQQKDLVLGKDYEIICVNDGSTDNSLDVLTRIGAELSIEIGGGISL